MTFLQHLGSIVKKVLHISVEAAEIAAPIVNIAFPNVAPIYMSALGLAVGAEGISPGPGTGTQKLAQVINTLEPQILAWATKNGVNWDSAGIQKWTSAVVDTLNLIPAPSQPPSQSTSTTA